MVVRGRSLTVALAVLVAVLLIGPIHPQSQALALQAGAQQMRGVRILIDPGHGGWDPGAVGPTGLTEAEVNLQVAVHLRNCLREYGGAEVAFTHWGERYVPLAERAAIANWWGADRFISIHHNGHNNPWVNGTEVFSHPHGSWASHDLRNKVHNRLLQVYGLRNLGTKTANFTVLRNTHMPAILTEASFITNPYEEARLKRQEYLWRQAYYIYLGIADHLGVQP